MFQLENKTFASDALEDAMCLAQTKALNSYTFSDCLNYLNYAWSDIYSRMAMIDDGFYGVTIPIKERLTHLPRCLKNTVQVYRAQTPVDHNRYVYREAGTTDLTSEGTYQISGNDLYVWDATQHNVWLYFVPACPQVFFTHHNRDPILHDDYKVKRSNRYNVYRLLSGNGLDISSENVTDSEISSQTSWILKHVSGDSQYDKDITGYLFRPVVDAEEGSWSLVYVSCSYPYIFCTYYNNYQDRFESGFYDTNWVWTRYNPFDFTGKTSNIKYLATDYNDKTGMGVVVIDYNDSDRIKELGWTPDTVLTYPVPEMYRYLVARLADKFSALNESNIMGVQKELVESKYAFEAFLQKDKSAWKRITNVNPPTIGDWL